MNYRIPDSFMEPFIVRECSECGLKHAAVRTCDEAREWASFQEKQ